MGIEQLLFILDSIPWWGWMLFVCTLSIIFGDRVAWEYEVKFPLREGIGHGKLEFECTKKKGSYIEISFQLEKDYQQQEIEIYLNQQLIHCLDSRQNNSSHFQFEERVDFAQPREGDIVRVCIAQQEIFTGTLALD
ncbi:MAG: hypothetical protein HRU15_16645 [Planctomycetes bacterium]|nr:hypothetical protein [Planctomycetota bacterium]